MIARAIANMEAMIKAEEDAVKTSEGDGDEDLEALEKTGA